jgi:hypothetical protein
MSVKTSKSKVSEMTAEVRDMIQLRHSAEQRGNFEPLGRLQWLRTEHGMIRFPVLNSAMGEGCGPDLAVARHENEHISLVVLGRWEGLPPLRVNTTKPCPKCRHACDVCDGSGKKLCELCGGRAWLAGPWLPCPGPGCVRDTGGFATGAIKEGCVTCRGTGQVPEQLQCKMCDGSTKMTCSRCAGSGKYSTGRVNGSVDWDIAPKCKACTGTTFVGVWKRQDEKQFANASLARYLVLGPILEFAISDPRTSRQRLFDVSPDAKRDLLVLLVPISRRQKPQKAYLVGGVVREREVRGAMSA